MRPRQSSVCQASVGRVISSEMCPPSKPSRSSTRSAASLALRIAPVSRCTNTNAVGAWVKARSVPIMPARNQYRISGLSTPVSGRAQVMSKSGFISIRARSVGDS